MTKTHINEPIDKANELSGNSRKGGDAPPQVQQKIIDIIIEEARKLKFDNRDIAYYIAIAKRESGFNPDAANDRSTASGIAQVVDDTAKTYGINDSNRFNARASIKAGLSFFAKIKSRLAEDYGTTSGEYAPLIYFLYHYGEYIHYNDRAKAKDPKPLQELIESPRYKDSKTVVDEAIRIEKILNGSHGLQVQLTDVLGKPMNGRKVIVVQKKAKPANDDSGKSVNPPASAVTPSQASTSTDITEPEINQTSSEDIQLLAMPKGESNIESKSSFEATSVGAESTDGRCDYISQVPVEWELIAYEVTTDGEGNLPEIESATQEPFLILIPRINYEEYNEAVSKQLICEAGNTHEIPAREEELVALSTTPSTTEKAEDKSNPVIQKKSQAEPSPTKMASNSTSMIGAAEQDAKQKTLPPPSPAPTLTFSDVVVALRQQLGWHEVYETSFAYIKQFFTRPKLPVTPLNPDTSTKKGNASVQVISSSLPNKETTTAKVKDKVTTAEQTVEKKVEVDGDAPWMTYAIQEQKKGVIENPDDHLTDSKWKEQNKKYKEENSAMKTAEKELKAEQKKMASKQDSEKIKKLEKAISQHFSSRDDALKKMEEIEKEMNNPDIVKYHNATTLQQRSGVIGADGSSDNTAWCSSFANWCISQAGYVGTKSARAKDWKDWGKELQEPKYGAITVVKRGENAFHVGFFVGIEKRKKKIGEEEVDVKGKKVNKPKFEDVEFIKLLGGNQGVGKISESAAWTKDKLVAYRWPAGAGRKP